MGKQINQYTKTRIKTSTQSDDLMDLDSTEDSGVTFESAKMKVSEFIGYILEQIPPLSLYVIDGTISANRTVTALGRFTKWVGGNVTIKMADDINDYGFTVENNLGAEKAEMGYDQSTSSGFLKIDNNDLYVNNRFVGIGTDTATGTENLNVVGKTILDNSAETAISTVLRLKSGSSSNSSFIIDSSGAAGTVFGVTSGGWMYTAGNKLGFLNSGNNVYIQNRTANGKIFYRINNGGSGTNDVLQMDANATAGETRLLLYDIDKGSSVRVSIGADNSGGTGYKILRVPN